MVAKQIREVQKNKTKQKVILSQPIKVPRPMMQMAFTAHTPFLMSPCLVSDLLLQLPPPYTSATPAGPPITRLLP